MSALSRRTLMTGGASVAFAIATPGALRAAAKGRLPVCAVPLPLSDLRLAPSDFATAVEADRSYLLGLSADRLSTTSASTPDWSRKARSTAAGKAIRSPAIRSAII